MIRFSISLPSKYRHSQTWLTRLTNRLHVHLVRRLGGYSYFFRHIFGHDKIKKVLGINLALMLIVSSFFPAQAASNIEPEQAVILTEAPPLTTQRGSQYPVEYVIISQGYRFYHPGIDLDGITGDTLYPIMAGRVQEVSYSRFAYGNAIIVNHGNGLTSLYAHLSKIEVEEGQKIGLDTKLGEMGSSGRAFGDHLHLEIRDRNYPINPFSILPR